MLELLNQLDGFDSRGDVKVGGIPAYSPFRPLRIGLIVGGRFALISHGLGLFSRTPPGDHGHQPDRLA